MTVMEAGDNGHVMSEKPRKDSLTLVVNAGMYFALKFMFEV